MCLNAAPEVVEKAGDTSLSKLKNLYSHAKDLSENEVRCFYLSKLINLTFFPFSKVRLNVFLLCYSHCVENDFGFYIIWLQCFEYVDKST